MYIEAAVVVETVYIVFCGVIAVMKFRMLTLTDKNTGKNEATITNVSEMNVIFLLTIFNTVFSNETFHLFY